MASSPGGGKFDGNVSEITLTYAADRIKKLDREIPQRVMEVRLMYLERGLMQMAADMLTFGAEDVVRLSAKPGLLDSPPPEAGTKGGD